MLELQLAGRDRLFSTVYYEPDPAGVTALHRNARIAVTHNGGVYYARVIRPGRPAMGESDYIIAEYEKPPRL